MKKKYEDITAGLLGKSVSKCTKDELVELLELVVCKGIDGPFGNEVSSPLGISSSNVHGQHIQDVCTEAADRLSKVDNKAFCDELQKSVDFATSSLTQAINHLWGESDVQKALDTVVVIRNVLSAMEDTIKKNRF